MKERIELIEDYIRQNIPCDNHLYLNTMINVAFLTHSSEFIVEDFQTLKCVDALFLHTLDIFESHYKGIAERVFPLLASSRNGFKFSELVE
mgnify:CR=1 FL=1